MEINNEREYTRKKKKRKKKKKKNKKRCREERKLMHIMLSKFGFVKLLASLDPHCT